MDLGEKGRGQMDSMMHRILLFILNNQSISAHVLMEEFYLSKNQLDYRIGKVNEFLQEKGFPVIIKSGSYYVLDIKKKYRQEILALEKAPVYYTAEERQIYILLLITLYEKFTLSGLAQKFRVSKNTILTDIKNLKILANRNGVGIRSARQTGYYLHGKEIEIRKLWTNLLKKEQEKDPTLLQSKSVLMIEHDLINEVSLRVEQLEKKMNVSFSEIKVSFLSMIIYLSIQRAKQKKSIEESTIRTVNRLLDKKTHETAEKCFKDLYKDSPKTLVTKEIYYITMHILSMNVIKRMMFRYNQELDTAIMKSIQRFEECSITVIENKEELKDVLYQHIVPASYRIRFGVPDENTLSEKIENEYKAFELIVKESIKFIEIELNINFTGMELSYIVILFMSFLHEAKKRNDQKKTAVVVCMHGISVSHLLLKSLRELFPQINFIRFMSLREYYDVGPQVDLIFSTVEIDTDQPFYLIKHFLTDSEKKLLREKVEIDAFENRNLIRTSSEHEIDELISLIGKYATIHSKQQLRKELQKHIFHKTSSKQVPYNPKKESQLLELLPCAHIQTYDTGELSFEEAIRQCGKPLLKRGFVSEAYIETIIKNYNSEYPYFVIAPSVAIPHAAPEDGVYELGMSLLRVKKPVKFSKQLGVQLLIMIAPKDKKSHLNAVTTLHALVSDTTFRQKLLSATYEKDIYQLLKERLENSEIRDRE